MKKLILLLALASVGLSSCYHAHVCPTYADSVEQNVSVENN